MFRGLHRTFYKATDFAEGLVVTARIFLPDKTETEVTLTDAKGGVYYFDYDYRQSGSYAITMSEDGVKKLFSCIKIDNTCCCGNVFYLT